MSVRNKAYPNPSQGFRRDNQGRLFEDFEHELVLAFPDVTSYVIELFALFGSFILLISVFFPATLLPQYTPQLAAQYTSQSDWYFLWIYQILKFQALETVGLPVALAIITLVFIVLVLLPLFDQGRTRRMDQRAKFVTLGAILVGEIVGLTIWGAFCEIES